MKLRQLITVLKGGQGSGNFGHSGRPGEKGGSGEGGGAYAEKARLVEKSLTKKDRLHIGYYTDFGYQKLNGPLRRGEQPDKKLQAVASSIDKAIEASGDQDPPWKVYRGISMKAGFARVQFSTGDEVELKGYQSTSMSEKTAGIFADTSSVTQSDAGEHRQHRPVVMEITSKKGLPLGGLSRRPEEKEILLGSNWKYRVTGVEEYSDKANGGTLVKLEVIQ
jgi:hypothetical protein